VTVNAAISEQGVAACLLLARSSGLCASAPVLSDEGVPVRARVGLALALTVALAPLRSATPIDSVLGLVEPLLLELALGLAIGITARLVLVPAEIAGQIAGVSLGLSFAAQYDLDRGEGDVVRPLAKTMAATAFIVAGGLDAIVRAAATPASTDALITTARLAMELTANALSLGLSLAAPIIIAAVVGNLVIALLHRAATAIHLFSVGLVAILLIGGLALLVTAPLFGAQIQHLAERAIGIIATQSVAP
jgi:flagellar biosynthesis protein FliR